MTAKKKPRTKPGTGKDAAQARKKQFVEAYISNGGNATDAARQAGFSVKTAGQQGSRLLKDVWVASEIEARHSALSEKYELTADAVLKNLAQAIFFDPRKLMTDKGGVKDISELDDDTAMALSSFEVTEEFDGRGEDREMVGYTKKLKWLDKNTAREQALKHLGLFQKDNAQRGPLDGLPRDVLKQIVAHLRA